MNIVIFGMGYVGLVSATCLSSDGHRVIGVDRSDLKVDQINAGLSPIVEPGVTERLKVARRNGLLEATLDGEAALSDADICFICVGTPSEGNGSVNTLAVEGVTRQIGAAMRRQERAIPVVVRSTVSVGTTRGKLLPILKDAVGPSADSSLLFHPEFMRESSAVSDYCDPPRIIIGEGHPNTRAGDLLMSLYSGIAAPRFRVEYSQAEMVKYCDNVFHALKIAFANEVGLLARANGVDSRVLMDIFCADRKLNISEKYLRPGFAFGGSCLPKDLRGFMAMAHRAELDLPLIGNIMASNRALIERAAQDILATGVRRIGIWGLAFKPNTDDLRESPLVLLAETLLGKGRELTIVDQAVDQARLVGGNQAYVSAHLPHLERLLHRDASALTGAELIVLGHAAPLDQVECWLSSGAAIYDLAGVSPSPQRAKYGSLT